MILDPKDYGVYYEDNVPAGSNDNQNQQQQNKMDKVKEKAKEYGKEFAVGPADMAKFTAGAYGLNKLAHINAIKNSLPAAAVRKITGMAVNDNNGNAPKNIWQAYKNGAQIPFIGDKIEKLTGITNNPKKFSALGTLARHGAIGAGFTAGLAGIGYLGSKAINKAREWKNKKNQQQVQNK